MFREALIIEALLIKAQVSPGAAQNSLRSLSAQAILMGIPVPHTLGAQHRLGGRRPMRRFESLQEYAFRLVMSYITAGFHPGRSTCSITFCIF